MKVICDRGALLETLNLVGPVVVARTPKPVLACVQVTADDAGLTLAATDMEASIRVTTPRVEVAEPGTALILADKLSQIVRESVDPTLTLETEGEATHIRGQDAHFKVFGYPAGDFPPLPEFKGEPHFTITSVQLGKLIHQTIYATARENSRYAINGVLMERDGNKVTVVATDGHRLTRAKGAVLFAAELVVWLVGGGTALAAEASAQLPGAVGLGLDLTLRDVQAEAKQAGRPWTLSKGFDGALPLGRFVEVTRLAPIGELAFALEVNGAPRQRGEASDMLLSVPELLAYISGWITLEPGDLVLTGTPKGVGPVLPGDTARLVLEGWHDDLVRFV